MRILACAALASTLALAGAVCNAEQTPVPEHSTSTPNAAMPAAPRIGLALSGGGARGFAHIGVLKVLEELRIPIQCVTGTSMGAIVGATYAAGMPPEDMQKAVAGTNWDEVFSDHPPRSEISVRNKIEDYKTLFAPEFGVKNGKLALPKGVIAGVSIEAYFRRLAEQAGSATEIERLPIPFHAVAADIATGEAVVLDKGSVTRAMRASMSVPGAMAPVEIDNHLLVDGGIVNNLPIDEARKMCADVVIAVNISTPPLKREEITSALSVSLQLINLLGKSTVDQQLRSLKADDVLIEPTLAGISAGDFDKAEAAVSDGEKAARAVADKLARYSVSREQYAALLAQRATERRGLGKVDEIRIGGLERTNPEVLMSLVKSRPGEELQEDAIAQDLRRIYGRGDFESVDYRIVDEPGKRVMVITPREKSWGPDYLRFGLGLATDFRGESPFNALVSYRKTWMNRLGAEWLNELQIGRDTHLFTEFYQPVEERGRYFVAPYAFVGQSSRGVFEGENKIAVYNLDEGRIGVDTGVVLGTWAQLRVGPLWRRIHANVDTGPRVLPDLKETSAGVSVRFYGDAMDHAWLPREGHRFQSSFYVATAALGSDRSYKRLEGLIEAARSSGPHTLRLTLSGGTALGTNMPAYETFTLGGPLLLSAYRIGELSGREMAFARLMYYNRAFKLPDILGSGVYGGASLEVGRVGNRFDDTADSGIAYSTSLFLAADTFLGPGYLGIGFGPGGRVGAYLLLGVP